MPKRNDKNLSTSDASALETVDTKNKNFLTDSEMRKFLIAARKGRHGVRDYCMMLLAYRHGLRVSELTDLKMPDVDLETARIFVRRKKGSLSTHQPLDGDELRAIRAWLRAREKRPDSNSPYLFFSERGAITRFAVNYLVEQIARRAELGFSVNPHMIRHSTGYYLANKGYDTRLIQDYLGHRNITHTVRYTNVRMGGHSDV
jgi:type 1 fimbriae regulatory protein FimB